MLKNRTILPRLDYLLAFEVAAELESFAAAAKEMNVSETAISRKIKLLELHYDCTLFVRGHRSVRLTDQGRVLLQGIRGPLQSIAKLSEDILGKKNPSSVRLSATNSVASLWLMPRMTQFHEANQNIAINLVSSDIDEECLSDEFDLIILRGDGDWPGYEAKRLFGETIFPVCAPSYLENYRRIADVAELVSHNLIEVSTRHTEWMNWRTWLERTGADPDQIKHSTSVNTYPLAVHAAIDGLGVALGWGHLVDRHLNTGALVRPLDEAHVRTRSGYYLLRRKGASRHAERDVVADWLLAESAARKRYTKRAFHTA
ncbi:LysR family transcriptional regulator [Roseovarius faecimaris]|uniref:LysR family transcriptional regulator n=1 Tax=Roseovarius faecimaris TaxID=2494550 RepID=A0A6I6INP2_9RHOB|nr:LysR substrate-binding domain-containing protein [Roseovarius faecimaris]QGX97147.1 LysR family transcriptional regulator [Roseovarius faecimaris]